MRLLYPIAIVVIVFLTTDASGGIWNVFDIKYWRCVMKKTDICPDKDIKFYLYTRETGTKRLRIDIRNHYSLAYSGYDPTKKNAIIIHGFNGTESKTPMTILRNDLINDCLKKIKPAAYLSRGDYNIFTVDWMPLGRFPCYLSALSNMKLVSQCTAKLYAFIMDQGGDARETTCVGHSLGAHICGMISNHLDVKQHKIVGLDPARPLINRYGNRYFRLSRDDAHQVQIIHTNAGVLGEVNQVGHVDFCVNGGRWQPGCKGHILRRSRCSHFQSACFFALTVRRKNAHLGRPCVASCPKNSKNWGYLPGNAIPMGEDTPFGSQGMYCVDTHSNSDCPFE